MSPLSTSNHAIAAQRLCSTRSSIQRRETLLFEFRLPSPPWMSYTFAQEMIPDTDSYLRITSTNFEGFFEYMWIGPSEKFLVSAAIVRIDPIRAAAVPVRFRVIGPNHVEVKLAGSDKWINHGIRRDEEILWWTIRDKDVPWTFVSFDDVPQWAHDVFARGQAKLEKDEQSEQAVHGNTH